MTTGTSSSPRSPTAPDGLDQATAVRRPSRSVGYTGGRGAQGGQRRATGRRVGIHLPQFGRASGPEPMRRAAQHAEALGFADVWVSDHVVQPATQDYPSPYLYDPLLSLTWAAAATTTVGLGTS